MEGEMASGFSLEDAICLATESLRGKYDNRYPRIIHALRVMNRLESPLEMTTALLFHSCGEGKSTFTDLMKRGVPRESVKAIEILENTNDDDPGIYALKISANPLAAAVKMADLREHLQDGGISSEKEGRVLRELDVVLSSGDSGVPGFVRDPESRVLLQSSLMGLDCFARNEENTPPEEHLIPDENYAE
jgi:hypothetical protein